MPLSNFQLLNKDLHYPRRNALGDIIIPHFDSMRENLKGILDNIDSNLAFTIDAWWAMSKSSFYGITVHFLDGAWNLVSTISDVVPADGRQTGRDIAEIFHNAVEFYGLSGKISGILFLDLIQDNKIM